MLNKKSRKNVKHCLASDPLQRYDICFIPFFIQNENFLVSSSFSVENSGSNYELIFSSTDIGNKNFLNSENITSWIDFFL